MSSPSHGQQPHVFLSYASADRERALTVADALEASGIRVWIDRRGIAGGTVWIEEIAKAVREAPVLLVLCSAASVVSRNVRQELQLAWDQDKPILPLLLEPVEFPDGIAYILHGRQWIELHDRPVAAWIPDVRQALAAISKSPPADETIKTPPRVRSSTTQVPIPPNALLGRDAEIAAITTLMGKHRLVTLTGPGGTGKTRLAIEVAARLTDRFPDGIYFVDLAPVSDPTQILATIAQVVGVRETAGQTLVERFAAFVADQRILLLIDNFEQVLIGARELADLLAAAPDLSLLVTSRAPLRIRAEHEVPISPLEATPATNLFAERAVAMNPGFALTSDNEVTIRELCLRLDGLPLAIELAAARIKLFTPQQLLSRLDQRLPTLTGGARDLPARQQTLRDTIGWSYDLLTPEQQVLFRRLAVFVGGCTFEAAETVGNHDGGIDLMNDLTALVDMSLVRQNDSNEEPRFWMLETIREFGLEQISDSGEESAIRDAHAEWCLGLAETSQPHQIGPGQERWLDWLQREQDNMRAAMARLEQTNATETNQRLAAALGTFWVMRGHLGEGFERLERALALGPADRTVVRARALLGAGLLAVYRGDDITAEARSTEALTIARELADSDSIGKALNALGIAARNQRDYPSATRLYEEALTHFRDEHQIHHRVIQSELLGNLAFVAQAQHDEVGATTLAEDALRVQRELGYTWGAIHSLYILGRVAHDRGDDAAAMTFYREGLELAWEHQDQRLIAWQLNGVALIAGANGHPDEAIRLFSAAERLREAIDAWGAELAREDRDVALAAARETVGEELFNAGWAAGRALPLEAMVAGAREVRVSKGSAGSDSAV